VCKQTYCCDLRRACGAFHLEVKPLNRKGSRNSRHLAGWVCVFVFPSIGGSSRVV
jgi:hypothetical protein